MNASQASQQIITDYFTYPVPSIKPEKAETEEVQNAVYNQKQAMAAAIGMYFGVRHITPDNN